MMSKVIAGFSKICVVGAGQMGRGIAQVCASAGLEVTLADCQQSSLDLAVSEIEKSSTKLEAKGIITGEQRRAVKNIRIETQLDHLGAPDLVIEAIVENAATKNELFGNLNRLMPPETIFASNTSSLPITKLATSSGRPDRFIGMHFMNPVPMMRLVEIIPGLAGTPELTEQICSLARALGKEVAISKDYPGFIVNRILMPMINEAFTTLLEGVAAPEDIDKGMCLGTNQPMGPLKLADFIGLDTCLAILEVLHDGLGDPRYRPSPLLRQYVDAGWMGKKSGRGVYTY